MAEATLHMPAHVRAFTDYMTSAYHVAAGRPGRPERPLQEVFKYLPIAYNSRASSIMPSGRKVERPHGQFPTPDGVIFGPSRALDFELEFAFYVSKGNALGQPVKLDDAHDHIFGYCLLNDWSARDIQRWESVLGPFQAKAFRSCVSSWVVTAEALAPFRVAAPERAEGDPAPLPHMDSAKDRKDGHLAVKLDAFIRSAKMRAAGTAPHRVTDSHFKYSYWTFGQMLVHHAVGGCNLETGDIISSGTVSGPGVENAACMAEITGGSVPVTLPGGETRLWLQDGDEVIFKGRAEREGYVSIGFGDCAGEIAPPVKYL
jgi:fumarylacetoacetase